MEKKKSTKGTKRTVALYLIILIILYVVIYVVPQVSDIFVETYVAEYGALQVEDEAECLFVRTEKTYTAGNSGNVKRIIGGGNLMRKGSHIVDVGSRAYYSDTRGLVSYYYDGCESLFTPENMETITYDKVQEIKQADDKTVKKAAKNSAEAGDVIFKIVDNQQWYLLCWVEKDETGKYEEGKKIIVDMMPKKDKNEGKSASLDNDSQINTEVLKIVPQGDKTLIILSCNRNYELFDKNRIEECSLITSKTNGILLETDSIVEENGVQGVYVVDKFGNYNFTPVKILDRDGDVTVVAKNLFYDEEGQAVETVENYVEILRPDKDEK